MRRKSVGWLIAVLQVAALPVPLSADLLLNRVSMPAWGFSPGVTSTLIAAFGGASHITVDPLPLTDLDYMLGFSSLWISNRKAHLNLFDDLRISSFP